MLHSGATQYYSPLGTQLFMPHHKLQLAPVVLHLQKFFTQWILQIKMYLCSFFLYIIAFFVQNSFKFHICVHPTKGLMDYKIYEVWSQCLHPQPYQSTRKAPFWLIGRTIPLSCLQNLVIYLCNKSFLPTWIFY